MRADRLLAILLLLQNNGRMTSRQLAERLEVSERTVHRDMEALGAAGVPILSERGSSGGWRLMEGYRTDLTMLNDGELQALLLASAIRLPVGRDSRLQLESALSKLAAAIPAAHRTDARTVRERLYIDGAGWHSRPDDTPWLSVVQESVWAGQRLRIRYSKRDRQHEDGNWRTVEPLGLVAKGNLWYVCAIDRGELRNFRVSRIAEAQPAGEFFDRPDSFDLAKHWNESTSSFYDSLPRYRTLLRLPANLLPELDKLKYVRPQIAEHGVAEDAENTDPERYVDIEVVFDTQQIACETLFSFGPAIEALEPQELRVAMADRAETLVRLYKNRQPMSE